jgi:hypothetical protein
MKFYVVTNVNIKTVVFKDVTSHGLVDIYECFGRFCCHIIQEGLVYLIKLTEYFTFEKW